MFRNYPCYFVLISGVIYSSRPRPNDINVSLMADDRIMLCVTHFDSQKIRPCMCIIARMCGSIESRQRASLKSQNVCLSQKNLSTSKTEMDKILKTLKHASCKDAKYV